MRSRLTWFVIAAMITGPLFGLLLHQVLGTGAAAESAAAVFALVTTSFLRLIKMIIAPLVFSTLVVGVARMEGAAAIARIGAKALGWFVIATLISMTIGLAVVQLFKPGLGLAATAAAGQSAGASPLQFKEFLDHIIPSSVVQAMANNEILQIVVFSLFFGAAASSLGSKVKRLVDLIDEVGAVILRVTRYVMALAPIAIFAALAATVLSQGLNVLLVYAKYIGSFYLALILLWIFFGCVVVLEYRAPDSDAPSRRSARRCCWLFQPPVPKRRIRKPWSAWKPSASVRVSPPSCCPWAIRSTCAAPRCIALSGCCSSLRSFASI